MDSTHHVVVEVGMGKHTLETIHFVIGLQQENNFVTAMNNHMVESLDMDRVVVVDLGVQKMMVNHNIQNFDNQTMAGGLHVQNLRVTVNSGQKIHYYHHLKVGFE